MTASLTAGSIRDEIEHALADIAERLQRDPDAGAGLPDLRRQALAATFDDLAGRAAYLEARAHVNCAEPTLALECIDAAAAAFGRAGMDTEAARTDLGRMAVLDDLGRHLDAIKVGEAMIGRLARAGSGADVERLRGAALENVGVAHGLLGNHHGALHAYRRAETHYRTAGADDDRMRLQANAAVELLDLGRLGEAVDELRRAAADFLESGDVLSAGRWHAYEARAHLLRGDFLASWQASAKASQLLGDQPESPEWARAELVHASTLTALNMFGEASAGYAAIEAAFERAGLEHDLADARLGRAQLRARRGCTERATEDLDAARATYRAIGDRATAAVCTLQLADLGAPTTDAELDGAIADLTALDRATDLAHGLLVRARRSSIHEAGQQLAEAEAVIDRHDVRPLRWRLLAARAELARATGDPSEAIALLTEATSEVDLMRETVCGPLDRTTFMAGRDTVHRSLVELLLDSGDDVDADLRVEGARARTLVEQMRPDPDDAVPGAETPAVGVSGTPCHQRGATVTWYDLGTETVAFVRIDGELRVHRGLASIDELTPVLNRLEAQWRRFGDRSLAVRQASPLLRTMTELQQTLHLALLAPLDLPESIRSLTLIPHGRLAHVPFAALHDGLSHLVERMPIAVAPSRTAASLAAARPVRTARRRLVLGCPDERAPRIADEIDALAALDRVTVLRGAEATTEALRSASTDHDIIHIATHGVSRPDSPLFSAVQLGDDWLTAAEAARLELDGQLVVLSTCVSGRQHGVGSGEELEGLPRAFLAAGARAVVVNLWQVDDDVACELMIRFHRELERADEAEALRRAQLAVMQHHPHPYHWASNTVVGAPIIEEQPCAHD